MKVFYIVVVLILVFQNFVLSQGFEEKCSKNAPNFTFGPDRLDDVFNISFCTKIVVNYNCLRNIVAIDTEKGTVFSGMSEIELYYFDGFDMVTFESLKMIFKSSNPHFGEEVKSPMDSGRIICYSSQKSCIKVIYYNLCYNDPYIKINDLKKDESIDQIILVKCGGVGKIIK